MKRAIILVLDSFGIGASEDANDFGDLGANTLGHIAEECAEGRADINRQGPLKLPQLTRLGLMHAAKESCGDFPQACSVDVTLTGAFAHAKELSSGKDTSSGHWEMTGVPVLFDWGYFEKKTHSFPQDFLDAFIEKANLPGVLGNCQASGTEIIAELGTQHMESGKPIVYTSADSVFQIACHEETFGLDRLLEISKIAFSLLEEFNICRVIARPFVGNNPTDFARTGNRRDFSVLPPQKTLLDKLLEHDGEVLAIGKISDIFAAQGISRKIKAVGLENLFDVTLDTVKSAPDKSIVFTNFVDFDSEYGHRRNVAGYAAALEYFDARLPELLDILKDDDILIITADHGCDPTWPGSDHTREHIPVLVYGKSVEPRSLGRRESFADIGQSLAQYFELPKLEYGSNFL
ncbi:MAG: phosphopentomutase [Candidatus Azotimanducaceae bacterium]|jgi:phosphopentomutase